MVKSHRAMREAFAQAVARRMTPEAAWAEAGYKPHKDVVYRAKKIERAMAGRIADIQRERGEAAGDLVATIEALNDIARKAGKVDSVTGLNVARGALGLTGRLQMMMRSAPKAASPAPPSRAAPRELEADAEDEPPLDDEAWLARFGPDRDGP